MGSKTTIQVESDTRDELRAAKNGSETYNDVLLRILGSRGDTDTDTDTEGGK